MYYFVLMKAETFALALLAKINIRSALKRKCGFLILIINQLTIRLKDKISKTTSKRIMKFLITRTRKEIKNLRR